MTITEALHCYFSQFRTIDWAFRVEESAEEAKLKRYTGGDLMRQQEYSLTSMHPFERAPIKREAFEDWLEAQNRRKHFPVLSEGKEVRRLECLSAGLQETAGELGCYQIKIRLTYYEAGARVH